MIGVWHFFDERIEMHQSWKDNFACVFPKRSSEFAVFCILGADHLTLGGGGGWFWKKFSASACRKKKIACSTNVIGSLREKREKNILPTRLLEKKFLMTRNQLRVFSGVQHIPYIKSSQWSDEFPMFLKRILKVGTHLWFLIRYNISKRFCLQ